MDKKYEITLLGKLVTITSDDMAFSYDPIDGSIYMGGFQCNHDINSEEYLNLIRNLEDIAKSILRIAGHEIKVQCMFCEKEIEYKSRIVTCNECVNISIEK
jgi:hypothetical protein